MTQPKCDGLDAKVLAAVRAYDGLTARGIGYACGLSNDHDDMRAVDRSLQRLRKSGKLTWTRAEGWKVAK